jgi:predicted secreted Zn-dependent protease
MYGLRATQGNPEGEMILRRWTATANAQRSRRVQEPIRSFAGCDLLRAVVEPEAHAVLDSYDEAVTHHDVVLQIEMR